MKYDQVKDGVWVHPVMKDWRLMCCDCHSVHRFTFSIKGGRLKFKAVRDNRATAQARRKR